MILERDLVLRLDVERGGQRALDAEKRLEYLPDRLAETLRRILHTRRLQGIAAVPRRAFADVAMIVAVDDLHSEYHDRGDDGEEDDRAVARAIGVHWRQEHPAPAAPADGRAEEHRVHRIDERDDVDRKEAQHHAAEREPDQPRALQPTGILG